jgi:hypothetical protein
MKTNYVIYALCAAVSLLTCMGLLLVDVAPRGEKMFLGMMAFYLISGIIWSFAAYRSKRSSRAPAGPMPISIWARRILITVAVLYVLSFFMLVMA